AVDPAAIGRMDDELHAARLVEEALHENRLMVRQPAERRAGRSEILDQLTALGLADPDLIGEEAQRGFAVRIACQPMLQPALHARDGAGKLIASSRRLAQPERDIGRLSMGVLHPDGSALDALDAIGFVAELEDVARYAFDGEILVYGADDLVLRLEQ